MALGNYPFPFDIDNLLGGAVRILFGTPGDGTGGTVGIPTHIGDVIDLVQPYHAKTNWTDLGATRDSFTYHRGFDTSGLEIQQVAGNVLEELTNISRTVDLSMAEFNPFGFQLMENAQGVTTIAAAAGKSAQKQIKYGSFSTLRRYRIAFVSQRSQASGVVTEPAGAGAGQRGRFVMGCGYSCQLTADEIDVEQDKGNLSAAGLSFSFFPDSTVALAAESWGSWILEDAGVIA